MNEEIITLLKYWEEARKSWNFNADMDNQWENLSFEEKVEILLEEVKSVV